MGRQGGDHPPCMSRSTICDTPVDLSGFPGTPRFAGCGNFPVALEYMLVQTLAVAVVLLGCDERVQEGSG